MVRIFSDTPIWSFICKGFQRFRECSKFSYFLRFFSSGLSGLGSRRRDPRSEFSILFALEYLSSHTILTFSYYFDIRHTAMMKEYKICTSRNASSVTRGSCPLCPPEPQRGSISKPRVSEAPPWERERVSPCEPRRGSIFHVDSLQPLQGWNYSGILFPGWRFADPGLCYETPLAFFSCPRGCPRISRKTVALCYEHKFVSVSP
jgi:hypothetical protein